MVNAKEKGAKGEREVASLLQPTVDRAYMETLGITLAEVPKLQRNLLQTREGGYDLVGLDWMALEVKRVEALGKGGILKGHIRGWWSQCVTSASRQVVVPGIPEVRDSMGLLIAHGTSPSVRWVLEREPVLFYRPNGWSWTVRMYGYLSVGKNGGVRVRAPVTVEFESFCMWLDQRIRFELKGAGLGVREPDAEIA